MEIAPGAARAGQLKDNAQTQAGARPRYAEVDPGAAGRALAGFADVMLVIDRQGYILSAAGLPDLMDRLGLADGIEFRDILTRESAAKADALFEEATADALGRARELNHQAADGSLAAIRYQAMLQGVNGDFLLVGRDLEPVTELQQRLIQAQQATERDYSRIRAMETRFRVLFQLSAEPMLICDTGTRKIAEANAASLAAFNLPLTRIVGRTLASLFDEHDAEALATLVTNAMSGGDTRPTVLRAAFGEARFNTLINLFRQDGASHFLVRPSPLGGSSHMAANDATFLDGLLEKLPEAFIVTDNEGHIVQANRRFLDLAELPSLAAAEGKGLDQWLGRPGIDFGVLLASLKEAGSIRGFSTIARGAYGASEQVDVTAVALFDHAEPRLGFLLRTGLAGHAGDAAQPPVLPRSVEQMKQLVGNVPMKDLVRETTDMIERLCIEAALELTGDNRASSADMLGLSRQSLYAKLHRFGLGDLQASGEADNT
jgi:transcriptional regulator PpsR